MSYVFMKNWMFFAGIFTVYYISILLSVSSFFPIDCASNSLRLQGLEELENWCLPLMEVLNMIGGVRGTE